MKYTHNHEGIEIECVLEYTPASIGARERGTGIPLEPDYPAFTELLEARVADVNILPLLRDTIIQDIEWGALLCSSRP